MEIRPAFFCFVGSIPVEDFGIRHGKDFGHGIVVGRVISPVHGSKGHMPQNFVHFINLCVGVPFRRESQAEHAAAEPPQLRQHAVLKKNQSCNGIGQLIGGDAAVNDCIADRNAPAG